MPLSTVRGQFPYPVASDPDNVPGDIQGLADRLALLASLDMQGTLAARPAAVAENRGLYYFVTGDGTPTNNDKLYRSTGAAWVEVLTGPAGSAAYEPKQLIAEITLGASGGIIFTNVPATFRHLRVVLSGRGVHAATDDGVLLRLNEDATASYDWQTQGATGATVTASEGIGATFAYVGRVPAASAAAGLVGSVVIDLPGATSTTLEKPILSTSAVKRTPAAGGLDVRQHAAFYRGLPRISTVSLNGINNSLAAGSVAGLYGTKGA